MASLGAFTTSCAPPANPTWISVQWARDAGGTTHYTGDPSTIGRYDPAWGIFTTIGGTTTGPTPPPFPNYNPYTASPSPGFWDPLPDGTARFPWNGYAGEGITVTSAPYGSGGYRYTAAFPGGSCVVGQSGAGNRVTGMMPSPDGLKIAVTSRFNDFLGYSRIDSGISIMSLVPVGPGAPCPSVVATPRYTMTDGVGEAAGTMKAWAPNSAALAFSLTQGSTGVAIVRLDATSGATPVPVLAASSGCLVPLGWSVENRLLLECGSLTAPTEWRMQSIPIYGTGTTNVIDSFPFTPTGTMVPSITGHFGYYAPGTNMIVFNKAVPVVNSDGYLQPWFQIHTVYDLPLAQSSPLTGTAPPLGWHQERLPGQYFPPYTYTDVPNQETIERFVR